MVGHLSIICYLYSQHLFFRFFGFVCGFFPVFFNVELLGGGGVVKAQRGGGWVGHLSIIYTCNTFFHVFFHLFVDFFSYFLI